MGGVCRGVDGDSAMAGGRCGRDGNWQAEAEFFIDEEGENRIMKVCYMAEGGWYDIVRSAGCE